MRPSIWLDWPGAPQVWDSLAFVILALVGIAVAFAPALPDPRPRWRSLEQWWAVDFAATALGSLYLMCLIFVHLLLSSDLAMSLVPGWSSPNFAAYQVVSALQGGVAVTMLVLAVVGGVPRPTFQAFGKLLLALSLLWFYFTWSEALTYWYGRTPAELDLLALLMFGPVLPLFVASALCCCVVPAAVLIFNPLRNSLRGVTLAASLIVVGLWLDRLRVYVLAWSVAGPVRERLDGVPATLPGPGLAELLIAVGLPAAALLLIVVALRVVPTVDNNYPLVLSLTKGARVDAAPEG
jgi:molybdopterin-containing oxidoreductase family membrane subunit